MKRRSPDGSKPSRASEANATARRRDLILHVERAASPDLVVDEIARPGVAIPLGRIGEHRVRVAEERERRPVAPLDPRDEVRPLGHARVELGLDSVAREVVAQELGRMRLVSRRVDGVEPEERLQKRGDLVAQCHYSDALESAVNAFRVSHSSGYEVFEMRRPSSSTGVP